MTVYNAAPWLREAVDSVINQTYTDWELVAIENGSTDASPDILASYDDSRIRVINLPANIGRTPALRRAFDLARGEYIAVLDADDTAEPARFIKQAEFLDTHPDVSLVGSWAWFIDGDGRKVDPWSPTTAPAHLHDQLGFANPIVHSTVMYRADVARSVGGYPPEYPYAQDCALWLRLAERTPIGMIDEYLGSNRTLPGSMTQSPKTRVMAARDRLAVLEEAARRLSLSKAGRRRNREERTIALCRYGIALIRAGQIGRGLACLVRAITSDPAGMLWNRVYRAALFGRP